jgi:AcrR family transcriptional regulator
VALTEFAAAGYAATSLQRVAKRAGLAKSSVLYHYASKEALLEAAVQPAIDRLSGILTGLSPAPGASGDRELFISQFVDFLLEHRLEVHLFINQGPSLVGVPVVDRANALVRTLAEQVATATTPEHRMRFGVALGGAAYYLVAQQTLGLDTDPIEQTRASLVTIIRELLEPIPPTSAR